MTIAENVDTMNSLEIEDRGYWRPWGTVVGRPDGTPYGIAWALRRPKVTDLFSIVGTKLLHYDNGQWNTIVDLNGQPVVNGLAAVGVKGLPEVFALTSSVLLHARFDGANWSFKTLSELPFGGITQLLAVHDTKDTDLFVVTGAGAVYTHRVGGAEGWKQVPLGKPVQAICGAAASAPGRREIAAGDGKSVRLMVSIDGGAYQQQDEPLDLDFATRRVLLVSPETNILYAVALADDASVAMSRYLYESKSWGQVRYGAKGNDLGLLANAVSPARGRIDVLATDKGANFSPRLYDK